MSTKRGARAAPRSTSSRDTGGRVGPGFVADVYSDLAHVAHETCDSFGLEHPARDEATPAERLEFLQAAIDDERVRHERELETLRRQLATMQALVRGVAEAFGGTPSGQVLDGLLLQLQAVTKGGAR